MNSEKENVVITKRQSDDVQLEAPPPLDEELAARLREKGYKYFGIFADDPGALELFDEIERQRDQRLI